MGNTADEPTPGEVSARPGHGRPSSTPQAIPPRFRKVPSTRSSWNTHRAGALASNRPCRCWSRWAMVLGIMGGWVVGTTRPRLFLATYLMNTINFFENRRHHLKPCEGRGLWRDRGGDRPLSRHELGRGRRASGVPRNRRSSQPDPDPGREPDADGGVLLGMITLSSVQKSSGPTRCCKAST